MSFLRTIEDQVAFGFTGRINILDKETSQFLGVVLVLDGTLIHSHYQELSGEKAMYRVLIDDVSDLKDLKFIVEPEIIEKGQASFELDFATLKENGEKAFESFKNSKSLRPPDNVNLILKPLFIIGGENVSDREYELMSTISDYSKVKDIYENSRFLEHEVTTSLVSLRKKGAIKVIR